MASPQRPHAPGQPAEWRLEVPPGVPSSVVSVGALYFDQAGTLAAWSWIAQFVL